MWCHDPGHNMAEGEAAAMSPLGRENTPRMPAGTMLALPADLWQKPPRTIGLR
jgi:hypothetical protein